MTLAILVPTSGELGAFVSALEQSGLYGTPKDVGRIHCLSYADMGIIVAQGGLGKVNFAITALHVIQNDPAVRAVMCVGTCGGLDSGLAIGDIVVATETVEHDFNRKLIPGPLPSFQSDPTLLESARTSVSPQSWDFSVKFGPIASGDEGIASTERARQLQDSTGAIAAAWEGAGGAKACEFTGVSYIEIRGVSDLADEEAISDFEKNTPLAMTNLARFITGAIALEVFRFS